MPTERWNASARGHAALLRQSDARFYASEAGFDPVAAVNSCLAAALAAETARFAE